MTSKQEIVWTGNDADGFVGTVNGVALYKIRTVPYAPGPRRKDEKLRYTYLVRRLNTRSYEGVADTAHTADEAKTACEVDYARNGGRAAFHKTLGHALLIVEAFGFHVSKPETQKRKDRVSKPALAAALAAVQAAGFRVLKPKVPKPKGRPGPVFAAEFADGSHVRMSVACSTETLDWIRGERLARQAWASRHKAPLDCDSAKLTEMAPPISVCRFERDGVVLAERRGAA